MATREYLVKDIEKVLEVGDEKVKSAKVTRLTLPGEHYSSLVLKVDFEVEKNGHVRTISTVAKRIPANNEEGTLNRALRSQEKEIIFYRKIVPLILNFAKEYRVYNEANFYPEFCGARYSLDESKTKADEEAVILLKNLIPKGYHVVDRYIGFDLESSKVVVRKLATFHAIPIAMKLKKPETFKILADYLESCNEGRSGRGRPTRVMEAMQKVGGPGASLWKIIENIPECAPYISRLRPIITNPILGGMGGSPRNEVQEPWLTISHNDFWGNILIKKNKEKEPSVILLDHARSSYDSFAQDLLFFLLTSVQNHVQDQHMDDLLRAYYDEFTRLLKQCEVSSVLSFEEYMDEVNKIAKQIEVGHSFAFLSIIFGSKNPTFDHLIGQGNLLDNLDDMAKNLNEYGQAKIVSIASLSAKRNWI